MSARRPWAERSRGAWAAVSRAGWGDDRHRASSAPLLLDLGGPDHPWADLSAAAGWIAPRYRFHEWQHPDRALQPGCRPRGAAAGVRRDEPPGGDHPAVQR